MKPGDYSEDRTPVLKYLVEERLELIIIAAEDAGAEYQASEGVARAVVGGQSPDSLTPKQRWHYDTVLRPLIEIRCDGVFELGCPSNELLDAETLIQCYQADEGFLCSSCRHDSERIDAE
jgi:hypothetical protein